LDEREEAPWEKRGRVERRHPPGCALGRGEETLLLHAIEVKKRNWWSKRDVVKRGLKIN